MSESILIAIVAHSRTIDADVSVGLMDFLGNRPDNCSVEVKFYLRYGQAIARNVAAMDALEGGFTRLLFIDSDMAPRWLHLERCLNSGHAVAGGTYAHKNSQKLTFCSNAIRGEDPPCVVNEFQRMETLGTGFMLIKTDILRQMARHPDFELTPMIGSERAFHPFFQQTKRQGLFESEDWFFCKELFRVTGERPWADLRTLIFHHGDETFPTRNLMPEAYANCK